LLAGISAAAICLAVPSSVRAQIAGENVNMVTGTGWPGGDPFLQRQNEPSIAVSSVNPQHLLAGANDYRTVDVPNSWNPGEKMAGDAWLGVFKSLDGGQTWKSYLMPGYPQENPRVANAKLYTCATIPATRTAKAVTVPCTSGADPVVRAGPDGMFYFGGIAFNRTSIPSTAAGNYGKVFLTRFIDLNDKEDGDASLGPVMGTDPIRYVDQKEVALGGPNDFVDKPWIAVDMPRANAPTCKIVTPSGTTRTFPGHTVYVAYLRIVSGTQSDVMVRHSDDCGSTWSNAVKVSDGTSLANEGPSLAIDPVKGHVYVTWRRVGGLNAGQADAIMLSRTFSHGNRFTKPRSVAATTPFDQPTTPTATLPTSATFRVTLFPSSAISIDPAGVRRLHVAWAERSGGSTFGNARVMVATKQLSPPPVTEYEPDENDSTCQKLDSARPADNRPVAADGEPLKFPGNVGVEFALGHQFMPSLTFSQGKLMLVYYDSRLDHTRAYYTPHTTACQDDGHGKCWMTTTTSCDSDGTGRCWTLNAENSFYDVVRGPLGAPVVDADGLNGLETRTDPTSQIFSAYVDEGTVGNVRHTVDVRLASAVPADAPDFGSAPLSKFPFGTRGDEGFLAGRNGGSVHVPGFGLNQSDYSGTISLVETTQPGNKLTLQQLQQLKLNPPNLPLFRNGSTPFMGDYIDVQGPAFVKKNGKWAFNTDPTTSPVFHAVWTSNEDVRAPLNGDWSKYVPIFVPATGSTTSLFNGGTRRTCDPRTDDAFYVSSRNQNVYTARITEGLVVSSPQNSKPLSPTLVRSFVIAATNSTSNTMKATFSFTFTAPVPQTAVASFGITAGGLPDPALKTVSADIAPHSTVSRTLFVLSSVPTAPMTGTVAEAGGASGFVLINPPGLVPGTVAPPDNCTGTCTGIAAGEKYQSIQVAANLSNANLSNANLSNANLSNANLSNANLSNANLSNANLSNANLSNAALANLSNANLSNANLSNANLSNANLSNANLSNANLSNANLSNASVSDLNYEYQNNGNTSTSFAVKVVGTTDPLKPLPPIQLILAKTYTTPTADGCAIKEEAHNHILASINDVRTAIVDPGTSVDPGANDSSVTNATLTLAPGEKAQITLRARVSLARMAQIGEQIAPQAVPQAVPPNTTTYGNLVNRVWTWTALAYDPTSASFTATVQKDSTGAINAGSVTFIANGTIYMGTVPVTVPQGSPVGVASIHVAGLPPGATVIAYYSGTNKWLPSNDSFTMVAGVWNVRSPIPATSRGATSERGISSLNGQLVLFGGYWGDGYAPDVFAYDTTTDAWLALGAGNDISSVGGSVERTYATATASAVYDIHAEFVYLQAWTTALVLEERVYWGRHQKTSAPIESSLTNPRGIVALDGLLYVLGADASGAPQMITIDPLSFADGTLPTVTTVDPLPSRVERYASVVANGRIYVMGGFDPNLAGYTTAVWEYTPGTGWNSITPELPSPRGLFGAAFLGGKIYAAGGVDQDNTNASLSSVDVFTPPDYTNNIPGSWAAGIPMPTARQDVSVAAANGKLYVIAGAAYDDFLGGIFPVSNVEEFTP
jgi:hypothetical protein